jgi:hypothetical protein
MAIVHAEELSIAHLDDGHGPKIPFRISTFEKSHWKIVPHPQQPRMGPKVAELTSVWWLDVSGVFSTATSNAPGKGGRYRVQWRMNLNVAQNDNVVVGTEFRAVTFRKDEVKDKDGRGLCLREGGNDEKKSVYCYYTMPCFTLMTCLLHIAYA